MCRQLIMIFFLFNSLSVFASDDVLVEEAGKNDQLGTQGVSSAYSTSTGESIVKTIQRDPFYRMLDQLGMDETDRAITDYELNDLTLIGVVWDIQKPIAMFKSPKGKRYIVKRGDHIGKNSGIVMDIDEGQVNIRETFVDLANKRSEKTTIKSVQKGA